MTPVRLKWTFHKHHWRTSENTGVYIMIHKCIKITVEMKIILQLGITTTGGTVVRGRSFRKVEKHWCRSSKGMRGEEEEAGRPGWRTGNLCGSCRVFCSNPIPSLQERTQEPSSLPGFLPEATLESSSWQLGPAMVVESLRSEVHLSLTLHAVTQPWQLPQKTVLQWPFPRVPFCGIAALKLK